MASESIRFDFLTTGADRMAKDFKTTGDNAAAAARGAKVLQDVIKTLGEKEDRTAVESANLAKALRLTGDAEDRAAAKALGAEIAIRRLGDSMKEASGKGGGGGFAGLAADITGFGAATQAADAKGSKFKLALAGLNAASGVLEPAMAGLVVAAGGLAAGFAAAGLGLGAFGLVAKSTFTAASTAAQQVQTAQTAYNAAIANGTKQSVAYKTEQIAIAKAYALLSPAQIQLSKQIGNAQNQWQSFVQSNTKGVATVITQGIGLLPKVFAALKPFLAPTEKALSGIIGQLGKGLGSSGFKSFIDVFAKNSGPAISKIATAIGNVIVGIGGILKAFLPTSQTLLSGLDKITAKFREWGTTLSGHSGFQSLMQTFKSETPQAVAVLKNLGTVLLNVGKAMFGLSSFSNSKVLLQALLPLSGVLASLSKNTDLDRIVLYLVAAASAAKKLGPAFTGIKAAVAFFPSAWQAIVKFAAATEGASVAETIAAAATRAWGLAMDALPWVALAAAVVAIALLIIKYHTQIWAFVQKVWHDILGVIQTVWNWIKANWPLLLEILLGPFGLAIVWVVKNFGQITAAVKLVLADVSKAWNTVWDTLKAAFRVFVVDGILGPLGLIIDGAAKAFGWIPGIGGKLKTAAKSFDQFRSDVNTALGGINNKTVNVSVAMTSATNPYPGGISGRKAAGGIITGGVAGRDSVPILAMPGEVVVPTHMVAAGAVDHLRGRLPGFAAGGAVGVNVATTTPSYKTIESSLLSSLDKLATAFAKTAAAATAAGGGGNPGPGGPGTLSAKAIEAYWTGAGGPGGQVANIAQAITVPESGRRPSAVQQGQPYATTGWGLWQITPGNSEPQAGINNALLNPRNNAIAAVAKYRGAGDSFSPWTTFVNGLYRPYLLDRGGWLMPGATLAVNNTGRPEQVLPPSGGGGSAGAERLVAELRALREEVRQLTGVAAAIPPRTGQHVAGAIGGAGADAAFRRRYPGR